MEVPPVAADQCQSLTLSLQPSVRLSEQVAAEPQAIGRFFERAFGLIAPALMQRGVSIEGAPFACYSELGADPMTVQAGLPIAQEVAVNAPLEYHPGGECAAIGVLHTGPYDAFRQTYDRLDGFLQEQGIDQSRVAQALEIYYTDPGLEEDESQWQTGIFYLLAD
jgi:effector-binding domain-containing protein